MDRFIQIDKEISDKWDMPELPKPEDLLSSLQNHFPEAIAIFTIPKAIIIEFDKTLVTFSQVKRMDRFYIDSFVTGRQFFSCMGC